MTTLYLIIISAGPAVVLNFSFFSLLLHLWMFGAHLFLRKTLLVKSQSFGSCINCILRCYRFVHRWIKRNRLVFWGKCSCFRTGLSAVCWNLLSIFSKEMSNSLLVVSSPALVWGLLYLFFINIITTFCFLYSYELSFDRMDLELD